MQVMDYTFLDKMRPGKMAGPAWLKPLAPHAQVESTCLHVMNSFTTPEDGSPGLKELIEDMIGDTLGNITLSVCSQIALLCMVVTNLLASPTQQKGNASSSDLNCSDPRQLPHAIKHITVV